MSDSSGAPALILRVSAPVTDMTRQVFQDLAAKVAAAAGDPDPDAPAAVAAVERLANEVAAAGGADDEIVIEFRRSPGVLLIEARCAGKAAGARHPLPA